LTISNTLKYIFLIHFLVSLFYGVVMFLSPEFYQGLTSWPYLDPATGRVLGAAFLGWSFASLFGFRAAEWVEVKIVVLGEIIFTLFGTIASLWMVLVDASIPIAGWLHVVLMAIFFVLFLYAYYEATR
jgi:hypothetical protein